MLLYNTHTHTECSHDSAATAREMCESALKNGLFGLSFTDHLDCEKYLDPATEANIDRSFELSAAAKREYRGRLTVSAGVELGDALYRPELAKKVTEKHPWDVILLSVHAVRVAGAEEPFSVIDFTDKSDDFITDYLYSYFNDLYETVNTFDYDVLAHLTIPLRYIVKKYGKKVDIKRYYPEIEKVLACVIKQGKTLEINTSEYFPEDPFLMPDADIIGLYKSLGGKKITLGSDAHIPGNISRGFLPAAELLKEKGFNSLTFYSGRKEYNYFTGKPV